MHLASWPCNVHMFRKTATRNFRQCASIGPWASTIGFTGITAAWRCTTAMTIAFPTFIHSSAATDPIAAAIFTWKFCESRTGPHLTIILPIDAVCPLSWPRCFTGVCTSYILGILFALDERKSVYTVGLMRCLTDDLNSRSNRKSFGHVISVSVSTFKQRTNRLLL